MLARCCTWSPSWVCEKPRFQHFNRLRGPLKGTWSISWSRNSMGQPFNVWPMLAATGFNTGKDLAWLCKICTAIVGRHCDTTLGKLWARNDVLGDIGDAIDALESHIHVQEVKGSSSVVGSVIHHQYQRSWHMVIHKSNRTCLGTYLRMENTPKNDFRTAHVCI